MLACIAVVVMGLLDWFRRKPEPQVVKRITLAEYWQGRDLVYKDELTRIVQDNAFELLHRINNLLALYGKVPRVNSGWRPREINKQVGGAVRSRHLVGRAIDLDDDTGVLGEWCLSNLNKLEACGLWLENPGATPGWVHLQSEAPASGNRVFWP